MPLPQPTAQEMLSSPDAFTRPINRAQAFTPFNMLPVTDMEDFLRDVIHPRPAVLGTHDVQPEDWGRLMNVSCLIRLLLIDAIFLIGLKDLALAWQNRLPLPSDGPTKRSDLVIDLLDLWNQQFFLPRNVELALYKGRSPKSGSGVGRPEHRLLPERFDSGRLRRQEAHRHLARHTPLRRQHARHERYGRRDPAVAGQRAERICGCGAGAAGRARRRGLQVGLGGCVPVVGQSLWCGVEGGVSTYAAIAE